MKNSKKTIKKFKNDIKAREAVYQNDFKEINDLLSRKGFPPFGSRTQSQPS